MWQWREIEKSKWISYAKSSLIFHEIQDIFYSMYLWENCNFYKHVRPKLKIIEICVYLRAWLILRYIHISIVSNPNVVMLLMFLSFLSLSKVAKSLIRQTNMPANSLVEKIHVQIYVAFSLENHARLHMD